MVVERPEIADRIQLNAVDRIPSGHDAIPNTRFPYLRGVVAGFKAAGIPLSLLKVHNPELSEMDMVEIHLVGQEVAKQHASLAASTAEGVAASLIAQGRPEEIDAKIAEVISNVITTVQEHMGLRT